MLIDINDREHATILAALRYWQREGWRSGGRSGGHEQDIATNGKTVKALNADDVDALCESINTLAISDPCVAVHVRGGAVQGAMSNVPGLGFALHDNDNQEDDDYEREDPDPPGEGPLSSDEQEESWKKLTDGMSAVF